MLRALPQWFKRVFFWLRALPHALRESFGSLALWEKKELFPRDWVKASKRCSVLKGEKRFEVKASKFVRSNTFFGVFFVCGTDLEKYSMK